MVAMVRWHDVFCTTTYRARLIVRDRVFSDRPWPGLLGYSLFVDERMDADFTLQG